VSAKLAEQAARPARVHSERIGSGADNRRRDRSPRRGRRARQRFACLCSWGAPPTRQRSL